ncbi:unnamed protein product [Darwinula stevensoni]|uniref:Uncharacterized protein n=1 Tax=Darwinula stevensoni TaxID=69355 RepID=A0A7R9AL46_9CRUS|nr:unnamed protein product [Darwinula stevensoni]CAG0910290.1 unnamed protein product [Darwinula stevensoni]
MFIKWKPTVLYASLALALLATYGIWKKNILALLLGKQIELPAAAWRKLLWLWVGYAIFMSALNAFIATNYSTDTWANFKLWGFGFFVVFALANAFIMATAMKKSENDGSAQ